MTNKKGISFKVWMLLLAVFLSVGVRTYEDVEKMLIRYL